jgi:hypothetical protein
MASSFQCPDEPHVTLADQKVLGYIHGVGEYIHRMFRGVILGSGPVVRTIGIHRYEVQSTHQFNTRETSWDSTRVKTQAALRLHVLMFRV